MLRLTLLDVLVEVEADDIGCVGVGGSRWLLFVGGGGLKRGLWCSRWCDGGGNRLSYRMVTVIMVVVNVVVVGFRSRSQKEGNLLWMMTNKSPLIIRVQIAQKLLNTTVEVPVSKRSSIFDDPLKEIQELTVLIKNDITALNVAVSDLQTLQNIEIADGNYSEDRVVHSTAVCDDLKNKLMGATKKFQDVLTARTENIKAHENRRQIFSTNITRENPLRQQTKTAMEPPPWSSPSKSAGNLQQSESSGSGVQVGNQLRRRLAVDGTSSSSQHMGASMLQQVVPQQETFSQNRAVALQSVESTITELSGIFTNLATMVAHQGELAIRIDDNMEETLSNVEGARGALLKHLNRISSNRWLIIKIFIILIIFLIIFLFFLA